MIIIKTSFSLDCQPLLTPLLRSCSCGWRCSSYTAFSAVQTHASSYISGASCFYVLSLLFLHLSSISTVTRYVEFVTKIHKSQLTSWHHDTTETLAFTTFDKVQRKLRRSGALTCSCSLDEKGGLGPHRTLFEHLHHPSVTGRSHRLLVHLQDQVAFYEASGCLRARLQHLANSSNNFINMLFRNTLEEKSCIMAS